MSEESTKDNSSQKPQSGEKAAKGSAISLFFCFFICASVLIGFANDQMEAVSKASFDAAKSSVNLAIGLIGIMALWLGLVRILEAGGFMLTIARFVRPLMTRLFPQVPKDHPAMGAMVLNISANMLGLGNAATPFGIKAMTHLDRLNPVKGTATNAMCMFLALNTSSVAILPLGVIGVRAAAGASNPASIFLPTIIATLASSIVAVLVASLLGKFATGPKTSKGTLDTDKDLDSSPRLSTLDKEASQEKGSEEEENSAFGDEKLLLAPSPFRKSVALMLLLGLALAIVWRAISFETGVGDYVFSQLLPHGLMPILMFLFIVYGLHRGVKVYEAVCEGAKQGFDVAVRIIPFLVAILVAIAMFRASGGMDALAWLLGPITSVLGMPPDVLPMAIIRPLSGSGAFGVMSSIVSSDPDSFSSYLASTMMGSTETTFYVMAVYFGAVGVTKVRYALVAALLADLTGVLVSCLVCNLLWQG